MTPARPRRFSCSTEVIGPLSLPFVHMAHVDAIVPALSQACTVAHPGSPALPNPCEGIAEPASTRLIASMIWLSVNRDFFML